MIISRKRDNCEFDWRRFAAGDGGGGGGVLWRRGDNQSGGDDNVTQPGSDRLRHDVLMTSRSGHGRSDEALRSGQGRGWVRLE